MSRITLGPTMKRLMKKMETTPRWEMRGNMYVRKHIIVTTVTKGKAIDTRIIKKRARPKGTQELSFKEDMETAGWKD
jgi:hypothetical protein